MVGCQGPQPTQEIKFLDNPLISPIISNQIPSFPNNKLKQFVLKIKVEIQNVKQIIQTMNTI